ncbi:MAG TPA: hemerythrin domain-containing protein [Pelomicrobium sp.]|nr:hemerythrin domain-containing protein [Pelomicrobium sp.]
MEATDLLMQEHRVIERVLAALERAARRLASGEAIGPDVFVQAAEFSKGFADGCHHWKEEGALFPAMEAAGVPREGGPIGVMLAEHEEGRRLSGAMRSAAERLAAGDADARAEVVRSAMGYVALLRQHIAKEDNVLFPMAARFLRGPAQAELAAAFERVERDEAGAGAHEKFLALAASIEKLAAQ